MSMRPIKDKISTRRRLNRAERILSAIIMARKRKTDVNDFGEEVNKILIREGLISEKELDNKNEDDLDE